MSSQIRIVLKGRNSNPHPTPPSSQPATYILGPHISYTILVLYYLLQLAFHSQRINSGPSWLPTLRLIFLLSSCMSLLESDSFFFYWSIVDLLLFSHPVMSNSLWPHGLQYTRPPCLSPSPEICTSSCSLHQWCRPAISSSDALFSFCPQSFPASGTFSMSHLLASDDQNTWASASASVLPVNIQGWSPLRLAGFISLLSKGL